MEKSAQKARNSAAAGRMKDLRNTKFQTSGFTFKELERGVTLSTANKARRENYAAMVAVPRLVSRPQGIGRASS